MPRVLTFDVTIKTGERGTDTPVRCCINGHTIAFEDFGGRTTPGDTFTASLRIMSFVHTLSIVGPDTGNWDIQEIEAQYNCADMEPYTVRFGSVALDDTTELSIWAEDRPSTFYV